jgi:hypothetical protein
MARNLIFVFNKGAHVMTKKNLNIPVGISNFKEMIEGNYYYVDKSLFIKNIINPKVAVTLIPRPRRFGKTLNLSMLQYFFEKTETPYANLFKNLAVAKHPSIMKHQGQYPVIFLTFKDVKATNWEDSYNKMIKIIAAEFERHSYVLEGDTLSDTEKEWFIAVKNRRADKALISDSLKDLSFYLRRYHKKKAIILIDEYDEPIHKGYVYKYYDHVIEFMRDFLCAGLKDNEKNMHLGVATGILRVAKESIFSGLNNLSVCSLLTKKHADSFGLLEKEVEKMLAYYGKKKSLSDVRDWYNGYSIANKRVYNPWSIIKFLETDGDLSPHWANTSDNALVKELIKDSSISLKESFELLFSGISVTKEIFENIIMQELDTNEDYVWSLLLFSGYLTFENLRLIEGQFIGDFIFPNKEVVSIFRNTVISWFKQEKQVWEQYQKMLSSLTGGDITLFKKQFSSIAVNCLSCFDISGDEPEKFYHALVLGMLVSLQDNYIIKSNKESGFGRYDVMLIPIDKKKNGIIIEFKKIDHDEEKTLEITAQKAIDQIEEKAYDSELRAMGIKNIIKLAIVFDGKKTLIKEGKRSSLYAKNTRQY